MKNRIAILSLGMACSVYPATVSGKNNIVIEGTGNTLIFQVQPTLEKKKLSKKSIQAETYLVGYFAKKLISMNSVLQNIKDVNERFSDYSKGNNPETKNELINYLKWQIGQTDTLQVKDDIPIEIKNILLTNNIPYEDVDAFSSYAYPTFFQQTSKYYRILLSWLELSGSMTPSAREISVVESEMMFNYAHGVYYNSLVLFSYIPPQIAQTFLKYTLFLTHFPVPNMLTRMEAQSAADRTDIEYQQGLTKLAGLVGRDAIQIDNFKLDLQRLSSKKEIVDSLQETVKVKKILLQDAKSELRKKCQILPTDSLSEMWGKTIKLASVNMFSEAISNLRTITELKKESDDNIEKYCKSASLFYALLERNNREYITKDNKKISGSGVVVVAFERQDSKLPLQIGDVVVQYNESDLFSAENWMMLAKNHKEEKLKLLRFSSDESVSELEFILPLDRPKIGMSSLFNN
jgi:hypothetical protein